MKHGPLVDQGGKVVQGRRVESHSGPILRTLQGGRVVLGKVVACTWHWSVRPVAANKQGVRSLVKLEPKI